VMTSVKVFQGPADLTCKVSACRPVLIKLANTIQTVGREVPSVDNDRQAFVQAPAQPDDVADPRTLQMPIMRSPVPSAVGISRIILQP
jgi:hypothetical protein